ncbi:hypothetical protein OMAG_000615 [Candidatus Omnitrophus magneticus]|uniref:Uncharacterized protein n=1 Tax=Candidatus Omnitrophus magneticus TaxID=1609969 RepID=A0A0F0CQG0_9BACT|nr:hypothetical protein OMAG_000615 [Candidatus Omnitrophus magneticus]
MTDIWILCFRIIVIIIQGLIIILIFIGVQVPVRIQPKQTLLLAVETVLL